MYKVYGRENDDNSDDSLGVVQELHNAMGGGGVGVYGSARISIMKVCSPMVLALRWGGAYGGCQISR